MLVMTTSKLVFSTDNPPAFDDEEDDACLGSQGVISTGQCVSITLIVTGDVCPVCIL